MKHEDKLPVLLFPKATGPDIQPAPKSSDVRPPRADPDDLARALAALRSALEDDRDASAPRDQPTARRAPMEDAFSPIGIPRPRWRAGSDLPEGRGGPLLRGGAALAGQASGPALDRDALGRRITSIHLPRLSIERWHRWAERNGEALPDDAPLALAIEGTHGPVIHATNRKAEQEGVHAGARVVDMRALCPGMRVEYADTGADLVALQRLALWARRWCPWTAVDGTTGIVMDTTGSDHLWGGEPAMLREVEQRLSGLGLSASLATAPTHGAAWALARFGGVRDICPPEELTIRVAPLPVRALRLTGDTVLLLQRLGLKTIAELSAVPRISLARRFSRAALAENPLMRLDQMTGRLPEPVNAPDDPPRFAVQSQLAEPVQDPTHWIPDLARELCGGLAAAGFGARAVELTVYRTDGEVASVRAATARATRDADHLRRLFDGKLDRLDPGFGFDLITLAATVAEKLPTIQTRLDGAADDGADLARLVDRLSARFGAAAIRTPAPHSSHLPERAEGWRPALHAAATGTLPPSPAQPRPLRLFETPEEVRVLYAVPEGPPAQFLWRRLTHRVTRFSGPERIAPEWWRDRPGTRLRDYYRIEDHLGARFWIYREGLLGDGRGAEPRWFIHGVFG